MNIRPTTLAGKVQVPGSKSFTHRAYVLAASADGPVRVHRPLRAADPDATLACIEALGARVQEGEIVTINSDLGAPARPLDCQNAGTGLRLLTPLAARLDQPVSFTGDASLSSRPNGPLLDALHACGVRIDGGPTLPYTVQGPMQPAHLALDGGTSSQFASALMLSLPQLDGDSRLRLVEPVRSRPYLDVTRQVLLDFGMHIPEGDDMAIEGGQVPRAGSIMVPADWSSAAFPMAAAAITQGDVRLFGLRMDDPQGDRAIVDHLRSFGARVDVGDIVRVRGADLASPGTIDVTDTPDLFPILAVVAANARGTTSFTGGATLRHKESDRIQAMARGLAAMGIDVQERPDGLVVQGGRPRGADLHVADDHRIHMAFYVAALAADGESRLDQAKSTMISFPDFHAQMAKAGAA